MGWLARTAGRYKQMCETSDRQKDKELATRYYKAGRDQAITAVQEIFSDRQRYTVKSISKEHGEILAETVDKRLTIVASIVAVRANETAVDLTVSTDKFRLLGIYPQLKQEAAGIYKRLAKKLKEAETSSRIG